jgi:hypothetical protein
MNRKYFPSAVHFQWKEEKFETIFPFKMFLLGWKKEEKKNSVSMNNQQIKGFYLNVRNINIQFMNEQAR